MKLTFRYSLLLLVAVFLLTACGSPSSDEPDHLQDAPDDSREESVVSPEGTNTSVTDPVLTEKVSELCGTYFKGGDYGCRLTVSVFEPELPAHLDIYLEDSASSGFQYFSLKFDDTADSWPLVMGDAGNFPKADYTLERNGSGSLLLVRDDKEEILYDSYYSTDMLTMPDAFTRPLNEADLLTLSKEQMALIRNEFFAAYGRKFTNEVYQEYFLNSFWYVPHIEPEDFSESVFTRLIRRNIAFLSDAEASFDKSSYQKNLAAYEALTEAPYLPFLQEGEVSIQLDSSSAEDMGIYYKALGTIALPLLITEEEYRSLDEGTVLTLCVDELTGETVEIKRTNESEYEYYDESWPYIITRKDGYSDTVNFSYQPDINAYRLWVASDDTVFRTVYEGDIYVLKGACAEYFHNFEYYETPLTEQPGVYQLMDFNESDELFMDYYYGNYPRFDEKGYLKALYFYGD